LIDFAVHVAYKKPSWPRPASFFPLQRIFLALPPPPPIDSTRTTPLFSSPPPAPDIQAPPAREVCQSPIATARRAAGEERGKSPRTQDQAQPTRRGPRRRTTSPLRQSTVPAPFCPSTAPTYHPRTTSGAFQPDAVPARPPQLHLSRPLLLPIKAPAGSSLCSRTKLLWTNAGPGRCLPCLCPVCPALRESSSSPKKKSVSVGSSLCRVVSCLADRVVACLVIAVSTTTGLPISRLSSRLSTSRLSAPRDIFKRSLSPFVLVAIAHTLALIYSCSVSVLTRQSSRPLSSTKTPALMR
jgi:hypothetical protein